MSGYAENAIIHHDRLDDDVRLLQKPFTKARLARAVHEALQDPSFSDDALGSVPLTDLP